MIMNRQPSGCVALFVLQPGTLLTVKVGQKIFREMVVWYRLSSEPHPNIVSFFGFVTNDPEGLALVSSRFSRGSATKYLRDNPLAERESLVLYYPSHALPGTYSLPLACSVMTLLGAFIAYTDLILLLFTAT